MNISRPPTIAAHIGDFVFLHKANLSSQTGCNWYAFVKTAKCFGKRSEHFPLTATGRICCPPTELVLARRPQPVMIAFLLHPRRMENGKSISFSPWFRNFSYQLLLCNNIHNIKINISWHWMPLSPWFYHQTENSCVIIPVYTRPLKLQDT